MASSSDIIQIYNKTLSYAITMTGEGEQPDIVEDMSALIIQSCFSLMLKMPPQAPLRGCKEWYRCFLSF